MCLVRILLKMLQFQGGVRIEKLPRICGFDEADEIRMFTDHEAAAAIARKRKEFFEKLFWKEYRAAGTSIERKTVDVLRLLPKSMDQCFYAGARKKRLVSLKKQTAVDGKVCRIIRHL